MTAPRLVFLLSVAERAVHRWIDARGRADHVTAATAGALFHVLRHPNSTMAQIATALQASAAGASGLLARMEAAGLVIRHSDAEDQRVIRVNLTAHGAATASRAGLALQELNKELTDGFDEAELAIVARWLRHVAATTSS